MTITVTGGDSCGSVYGNRSLKLWLTCDPDGRNVPDSVPVTETNACLFEISIASVYGCPRECPIGPDPNSGLPGLCSSHGICAFDTALQRSRCFCNNGWAGADCGTRGT